MKNMRRALGMALKYRWSLICSTICAVLVALLWGANIGGVLPVMEVVFKGQSLHQLVEGRIEDSQTAIQKHRDTITELQQSLAQCNDPQQASSFEHKIALQQGQITSQERSIAWMEWIQPSVVQWTPDDPFQTLLFVFAVLFVGTLLRCFFLAINMYLVDRVGQRTILDIQDQLFRNAMSMEWAELEVQGNGDLISRIRNETSAIAAGITTLFGKTLREAAENDCLHQWSCLSELATAFVLLGGCARRRSYHGAYRATNQTGSAASGGRIGQTARASISSRILCAARQSLQHARSRTAAFPNHCS